MKKTAVIGAGTMGHGIAQLIAMHNHNVALLDVKEEMIKKAKTKIKKSLSKVEEKGMIDDAENVMERIQMIVYDPAENLTPFKNAMEDVKIAIEAVFENIKVKKDIFSLLGKHTPEDAILASNTSSLPITEIAEATENSSRVIGMHFFNPPQILKLVEVVQGENTSEKTAKKSIKFAKGLGKKPVLVKKDVPGFIVNRILIRLLNEACATLERDKSKKEAIDATLKHNANIPMGAFELLDYSGIDVFYDLAKAMKKRGFNITIAKPLREKAEKGDYGRKTGKGFYNYQKERKTKISKEKADKADYLSLFAPAINEAAWIVRKKVATREEVNRATKLGLNYPKGIFKMAQKWGIQKIIQRLEEKMEKYGPEYKPDPYLQKLR